MKKTFCSKLADAAIYSILILVTTCMLLPFLYVVSVSLMTTKEYLQGGLLFIPLKGITIQAYKELFKTSTIFMSYGNTLFVVIVGTSLSLMVTTVTSYALSKKYLKGKNLFLVPFIITMLISGGIIPNYILVRQLGLMNSLWSVILPLTVNTYFMIILKNFFLTIPDSLEEAAYLDGCNEFYMLIKIYIPLSLPAMATIGLFYAVNYWNSFFLGVLYITEKTKWPLQLLMRELLISADLNSNYNSSSFTEDISSSLRMATIVVSIVPIACVYPFLQKYFIKGVLIGGVKG